MKQKYRVTHDFWKYSDTDSRISVFWISFEYCDAQQYFVVFKYLIKIFITFTVYLCVIFVEKACNRWADSGIVVLMCAVEDHYDITFPPAAADWFPFCCQVLCILQIRRKTFLCFQATVKTFVHKILIGPSKIMVQFFVCFQSFFLKTVSI